MGQTSLLVLIREIILLPLQPVHLDRLFLSEKSKKSIGLSTGYPQPVENFLGKTYTMEAKRA